MKFIYLFFLCLCLVEIYAQRSRTTNQESSKDEPPKPVRGRGRSRFTTAPEASQASETLPRPTTNRRASTRTRIHTSATNKAIADRRARPTETPRQYSTEEVNNDSPIDSFRRQSKGRVLTESRFEIPTLTASRRPTTFESARTSPAPAVQEELPIEVITSDFGSTARAILQARGETLPPKTTTPNVDEEYLLNNFGSTIRSLAASRGASRNEAPSRATALRSEVPILDREDIPSRRSSLRGDPLPSLRGSEITLDREPISRSRGDAKLAETRERVKPESRKLVNEPSPVVEDLPLDEPDHVQGIFEQIDQITETQPFEVSSEVFPLEEDDFRKSSSVEVTMPKTTESSAPRRVVANNRRNGARGRSSISDESQSTLSSRGRVPRIRSRPDNAAAASTVSRSRSNRRYDDASVAESRISGPSVFTAEQTSEATTRSRTERRIDTRYEAVPQRVTIDLPTTIRSRSTGRRTNVRVDTSSTEKSSKRSNSRGRSRSGSRTTEILITSTTASPEYTSRSRPSSVDDLSSSNRRPSNRRTDTDSQAVPNRRENTRSNTATNRQSSRKQNNVDNSFRSTNVEESTRRSNIVQEVPYGSRSKTRAETTLPTTSATSPKSRSRTRFPETAPKLDESKLEVLPLFEREPRTEVSSRSRGQRSRSNITRRQSIAQDYMQVSATEDDVKFIEKPTTAFTRVTVTRTESVEASTSRARLSTRVASSSTSTLPRTTSIPITTTRRSTTTTTTAAPSTRRSTATTTTATTPTRRSSTTTTSIPTTKKWVTRAPPLIKESVVAEVNEVTSKSTIMRRKKVPKTKVQDVPKTKVQVTTPRGTKKSEVKLNDVGKKKGSEEEIDEEDNYPAAFKALLQAKKKDEESRTPQPSTRGASTSTEKVIVTSSIPSRASSTARVGTTSLPAVVRKPQVFNEIVNDNDNELDPRSGVTSTTPSTSARTTRPRQLPKFSEKPKFSPKSKDRYGKSTTEKPKTTLADRLTKPTSFPRKSYSPKSTKTPLFDHNSKRKALRSTAFPPSTTPLPANRESKFSAKFVRKDFRALETENGKNQAPKGFYSSRKRENEEEATTLSSSSSPNKKFNSSRFSSRYRSELPPKTAVLKTATSKSFYIPTIPTPAYVPTVPTVRPSIGQVDEEYLVEKDRDLGVEVISFDEPVNSIPSADLVNGEYLATDKNARLPNTVKDGTSEKPVSIIERIINSITSISTTAVPNTTNNFSSTTTTEATENSAILKLAPKKTTTNDKTTKSDDNTSTSETITSEKPTTIIEKILSSLSAIQSNEVGTSDFNTVSSSSTTPLSTVTKYSAKYRGSTVGTTSLPAPVPLSTSSPLSVINDVNQNEIFEKQTISKLLDILNGLVSTQTPDDPSKLVVVTPKNTAFPVTSSLVATTVSSQEPLEAISLNEIDSRSGFVDSSSSPPIESTSTTVIPDIKTDTDSLLSSTTVINVNTATPLPSTDMSTMVTENLLQSNTESPTMLNTASTTSTTVTTETVSLSSTPLPSADPLSVEQSSSMPPSTTDLSTFTAIPAQTESTTQKLDPTLLSSITTQQTTTQNIVDTTPVDMLSTTPQTQATTVSDSPSTPMNSALSTLPTVPNIEVDSNREGRLLDVEQIPATPSSTTSMPTSTMFRASMLSSTTANNLLSMNSVIDSAMRSSTTVATTARALESSTVGTNMLRATTSTARPSVVRISSVPSVTSTSSTTPTPNVVKIIAVPGETRISKSQTTTVPPTTTTSTTTTTSSTTQASTTVPNTSILTSAVETSTSQPSTTQSSAAQTSAIPVSTSTISQSTETIPPALSEILNGRTVNALNNLISADVVTTTTQATNFKTLKVNQTTIASTLPSTTTLGTIRQAPFTSPIMTTESTTQLPSTTDGLATSTFLSTIISASTKAPETSTPSVTSTTTPTTTTPSVTSTTTPTTTTPTTTTASTTTSTQATTTTTTTIRTTTSAATTTTQTVPTTMKMVEVPNRIRAPVTTMQPIEVPRTPTGFPILLPSLFTTLFPTLRGVVTTPRTPLSSTRAPFTSPPFIDTLENRIEVLSTAGTTAQPSTVLPPSSTSQRLSTTTATTTTSRQTTTPTTTRPTTTIPPTTTTRSTTSTTTTQATTTTTVPPPTTNIPQRSTPVATTTLSTKDQTDAIFEDLKKNGKLRNLNEEQRRNLEEIERIEKEQAELLKQLNVLATMFGGQNMKLPNVGNARAPQVQSSASSVGLANRVISMAMARDRSRTPTTNPPSTTTIKLTTTPLTQSTTKRPNSIQDQLPITEADGATKRTTPSLEDILKQYNLESLSTPSPLPSTYGKTNEALLAAILKDQGIGPTTPKDLAEKVKQAGVFEENPTTKASKSKPKPRPAIPSRPPGGRLMQGLNWLLDLLDPPTTKRPAPRKAKPKVQPKVPNNDEELLSNQPTRITPVVTAAPVTKPNLSQEEIQVLIKQLEAVQSDPKAASQLDFSKIKSLQSLIDVNEGVQVTSAGLHGATSRATPRPPPKIKSTTPADEFEGISLNKKINPSTASTLSVSNSIDDDDFDFVSTTARTRALPPVSLNPIPGIDDQGDSLIRGNLLTAAVNVTRAISTFLGSALQDAAFQLRYVIASGSNPLASVSSGSTNVASASSSVPKSKRSP